MEHISCSTVYVWLVVLPINIRPDFKECTSLIVRKKGFITLTPDQPPHVDDHAGDHGHDHGHDQDCSGVFCPPWMLAQPIVE